MWNERIQTLITQALKGSMISKVLRIATIVKKQNKTLLTLKSYPSKDQIISKNKALYLYKIIVPNLNYHGNVLQPVTVLLATKRLSA